MRLSAGPCWRRRHTLLLGATDNLPDSVVTTSSLLQLRCNRLVACAEPIPTSVPASLIPETFLISGHADWSSLCRERLSTTEGHQLPLRAECQLFGADESTAVLKDRAAGKQRDAIILAMRQELPAPSLRVPPADVRHCCTRVHIRPTVRSTRCAGMQRCQCLTGMPAHVASCRLSCCPSRAMAAAVLACQHAFTAHRCRALQRLCLLIRVC